MTTDSKKNKEVTFDEEKNLQVISDLYKNDTMAQNCIKTLLPYVEEQALTKALHKQVEQYDSYIEQIGTTGEVFKFEPTPVPKSVVWMSNMALKAKMLADRSSTHIAKIMLQGTLNGIIDLYRLAKEEGVHPDVQTLQKQLLRYEEGRFENLKDWL